MWIPGHGWHYRDVALPMETLASAVAEWALPGALGGLGLFLLLAGASKLRRRWNFAAVVRSWGFSQAWAARLSLIIPLFEVIIGGGAVAASAGAGSRGIAGGTAAALFGLFAVVQVVLTLRGTKAPCGCHSSSTRMIGWDTTMRVATLSLVAVAVTVLPVVLDRSA